MLVQSRHFVYGPEQLDVSVVLISDKYAWDSSFVACLGITMEHGWVLLLSTFGWVLVEREANLKTSRKSVG